MGPTDEAAVFELLDWHLCNQPSMRLQFYALEAMSNLKDTSGDLRRRSMTLCRDLLEGGVLRPGPIEVDARASFRSPPHLALVYLASFAPAAGYGGGVGGTNVGGGGGGGERSGGGGGGERISGGGGGGGGGGDGQDWQILLATSSIAFQILVY